MKATWGPLTDGVAAHHFEATYQVGRLGCVKCGLVIPENSVFIKQLQEGQCLKIGDGGLHSWTWQENRRRFFCSQCRQDVTYQELDDRFNPNNTVAYCRGGTTRRALPPATLPEHRWFYSAVRATLQCARCGLTYSDEFLYGHREDHLRSRIIALCPSTTSACATVPDAIEISPKDILRQFVRRRIAWEID